MARHGLSYGPSPPVILALENATACGSVAIVTPEACLYEQALTSNATHSQRLLASLERALDETALHWPDIDAIAVSLGPGSFTGLRIVLSTVKGLAMATGKQLIGISSLDGLAAQFHGTNKLVCPVLDARKKQVYTAFYRADGAGCPRRAGEILSITPAALAGRIDEPVILAGDGAVLYHDVLAERLGDKALFAPHTRYFPKAGAIGALALEKHAAGDFIPAAAAVPIYARLSDAELNFKTARRE